MTFTVIPAIDVRGGAVVRLIQGDYDQQKIYATSPIDAIAGYAGQGASWLHLVDLDAARLGRYTLTALVKDIRARTRLAIQTGGGLRVEDDIEALLEAGASRVVLGTVAVREPARVIGWLKTFGNERITLALDTHQDEEGRWRLPVRGWTEDSGKALLDLVARYAAAGLRHLLCTDIARDGMLTGFNIDLYRTLADRFPDLEVQASGGVRSLDDIRAAREAGARGAILGRALLEKRFTMEDALAC